MCGAADLLQLLTGNREHTVSSKEQNKRTPQGTQPSTADTVLTELLFPWRLRHILFCNFFHLKCVFTHP